MKYLYFLTLFSTFSLFAQIDGNPDLEVSILSRDVISGMEMSISSDGRIFIAERDGRVRLYDSKTKKISTILELETDLRLESGFMGIALDPNFDKTGWIYLYHTVPPKDEKAEHHYHHLGRFDFRDGKMIPESEKVLLKVRAAFVPERIHEAGSIAFDKNGLLYLSVGDNQIRSEYLFSCKTSANTNDLRGKILRIKPEADGSYSIPEGNLFPEGTPKTKPEIYIMGLRNPFRISVDKPTGWLLWGENGPPNQWVPGTNLSSKGIPDGYDEFNLAKQAGFYGYPLVIADQEVYTNYDFQKRQSKGKFSALNPINDHPQNTGLQNLPPSQPALIWYAGKQEEYPEFGGGGESAIGGPLYRMHSKFEESKSLPKEYDHSWLVADYARGWVKAIKLSKEGKVNDVLPILPRLTLGSPVNIKVGPNGEVYVLYYKLSGQRLLGTAGYLIRIDKKGVNQNSVSLTDLVALNERPKIISKNDSGFKLMKNSDCFTCHQWNEKRIGPSFSEIAAKYKLNEEQSTDLLIDRVIKGSSGVWGAIPMVPHPQHSKKDVKRMLQTIFKLNKIKEH